MNAIKFVKWNLSCFESGIASVDKDHDLVTFPDHLCNFTVANNVHHLHLAHWIDLRKPNNALMIYN